MSEDKKDWCPTQGGTTYGYEPWYRENIPGKYGEYGEWQTIPIKMATPDKSGIPHPRMSGVLMQIGLYGYAQAMAFAWSFAAEYEAYSFRNVEVKVVPYKVIYDIKARNIEGEEKEAVEAMKP